tara:strand:+ start:1756 stop:1893 length:138 start_codon:yes stop_codon:yes gene_type:complete
MIEHILIGWSLGGLSIIVLGQLFDSYTSYRTDLKLSRCKCKESEE